MADNQLLCATTNEMKFNLGKELFAKYSVELKQAVLNITEIQGEDPDVIVRDKVQKAYDMLGQPVIVTDDSWGIPALKGFPGPYMKSMNHWLGAADFLRLTSGLKDRRIFLYQFVAYQDESEAVVFRHDIPGTILEEPRGTYGPPILKIVALDSDNGLSVSQTYDNGTEHDLEHLASRAGSWKQLAEWYTSQKVNV